jgi:hypothetical protein
MAQVSYSAVLVYNVAQDDQGLKTLQSYNEVFKQCLKSIYWCCGEVSKEEGAEATRVVYLAEAVRSHKAAVLVARQNRPWTFHRLTSKQPNLAPCMHDYSSYSDMI